MRKATLQDLYDTLSYRDWKTKPEMIAELGQKGLNVSGYFAANARSYLQEWEREKLISSREREISAERLHMRRGIPLSEYRRISTGIPEKLQERAGGLEESLVKA